jgi:hypothetical protein
MAEPTTTDLMNAIIDLHGAMQHGFARMEERFEIRFTGVEGRLGKVETRLTSVETRLTSVETHLTSVEIRLTSVDGEVRGIRPWMERSDQRFAALERKRL